MAGTVSNSPSQLPLAGSVGESDLIAVDQYDGDGGYVTRGVPLQLLAQLVAPLLARTLPVTAGDTAFVGSVTLSNLPTAPDGLMPGQLWNNGGVPCIA
ncbi:hypothetical protein [Limobrevibacterium gyesilva]|uniref:Uncharacterized protein n=1 Tax=Limobrevibacterium gyesilva TaxID=2991712 RepID=A0AA41YNW4_9PROT|nr:hypothetical protein [Limobrevibacterium gyesilva]MCW3477374.1 hypothetical protein [Limobrevibacterium gyesilva]